MDKSLTNRIGKALLIAIFATGILYVTGNAHFEGGVRWPLAAKIVAYVFLLFLMFFGLLNILHIIKTRKRR